MIVHEDEILAPCDFCKKEWPLETLRLLNDFGWLYCENCARKEGDDE